MVQLKAITLVQLFVCKFTRHLSLLATSHLFLSILKVTKHASTYFNCESPMKATVTEYISNGAFYNLNCVIQHPDSLGQKCCNTDGNLPPLRLQCRCLWVGVQNPTGQCNVDGREAEGYVINSFDALHLLFKRSVTTIYDRDCSTCHYSLIS